MTTLFDQEKWWPLGYKMDITVHNGILPLKDNLDQFNDTLILTKDDFENLRNSILSKYYQKQQTYDDVFLDNHLKIIHEKSFAIFIISGKVKSMYYSKLFDCYCIVLEEKEEIRYNSYSVAICDHYTPNKVKFKVLTKKINIIRDREDFEYSDEDY